MVWEALAAAPLVLLGLPGEWQWGQHWRGNKQDGSQLLNGKWLHFGEKNNPPKKKPRLFFFNASYCRL